MIHLVDAAGVDGRDPVESVRAINRELASYQEDLALRPQIIAANKIDAVYVQEGEKDPVAALREAFEPEGYSVYAVSAVTGEGIGELLSAVMEKLRSMPQEKIRFSQEYFPEEHIRDNSLPFTVERSDKDEHLFIVEGPKIEKMLGYTNLEAEKGFRFFQNFLKDNGILEQLEELGIRDGDTVRMYGLSFDYYKGSEP